MEHSKKDFDISIQEMCIHKLTMNEQYIIFLYALRNGKYDEVFNNLDFEFFKYIFNNKSLKEFLVEL